MKASRATGGQGLASRLLSAARRSIVIGAKGERLKRIGTQARHELNAILGQRLHLTLWVKVREDWADNAQALRQLGLE